MDVNNAIHDTGLDFQIFSIKDNENVDLDLNDGHLETRLNTLTTLSVFKLQLEFSEKQIVF